MGIGNIFHILLINPIFNILLVFIFVFSTWALPGALGWAIIALTSMFRIAFSPLYKKQMHMAKMCIRDSPEPDMIVRTGGEMRMSGFMIWQGVYAEYYFIDKLFPELTPDDMDDIVAEYARRERRFGGGK